ncbi:MAG TPA: RNase adapter RapZ [Egibacteraceae bacterium]|nr:RNase adapter RapZ [Actinomycetota bacterium]HWB72883.1 RNase adapter RapZ [Egibacteraceae bacterium]
MTPQLAIITGLSGAGRTTAAKVLEDLGYFVIDNLPPSLIERVVDLATARGSKVDRVALVLDVRGRQFFGDLRETLRQLEKRGLDLRILFLEAGDEALVQRYEAARRVHPLAGRDRVIDGIDRERTLLADLRAEADLVIDTTDTNVHELRDRIMDAFGADPEAGMVVNVVSFGFKNGTPRDADIILDVRFLPNPHWVDELRPYSGLDRPVRDYVLGQPETGEFLRRLNPLFDLMVPAFVKEGKRYLTIAVGCTGGRHRSVVLGEEIAAYLRSLGVAVQVDHRDRLRE